MDECNLFIGIVKVNGFVVKEKIKIEKKNKMPIKRMNIYLKKIKK